MLGDRLVVGEVLGELRDAAVVTELLLDRGVATQVADHQLEARHDERRLSRPAQESVELEGRVLGEDLSVGPEPDVGAGLRLRDPAALPGQARLLLERRVGAVAGEHSGYAAAEAHALLRGSPVDVDVEARGEGVHDGGADAVQPAGRDVRRAAELPARVQLGEDHLDPGEPGLGLLVDRDATPVVVHLRRAVGMERDLDQVAGTGQGLVHAVVDDLPQAVHEPAGVGRPDVHARALADRLQPLEDEKVCCVVGVVGDRGAPVSRALVERDRDYRRHAGRRCRHAAGVDGSAGLRWATSRCGEDSGPSSADLNRTRAAPVTLNTRDFQPG